MTPKNSPPYKPPSAPIGTWEWILECEERSLDRMIEAHRREEVATRAILGLKERLFVAGVWVRPTSRELFLMASDWRDWAKTESDPENAAKLRAHGDRCEMLGRSAHRREAEEAKAKRWKRSRRNGS